MQTVEVAAIFFFYIETRLYTVPQTHTDSCAINIVSIGHPAVYIETRRTSNSIIIVINPVDIIFVQQFTVIHT